MGIVPGEQVWKGQHGVLEEDSSALVLMVPGCETLGMLSSLSLSFLSYDRDNDAHFT